jgi:hypothetical protein
MTADQIRAQAAREFDSRPALAAEFSSKEAYVAFKAAEARGACRIFSKPAAPAARGAGAMPSHAASQTAPRVEPGYGADSGVRSGGGAGGFVYSGEFASRLGQTQWACPVSDATLKVALGVMQSGETRNMGRNAIEQLIAKRAGVGLDVAGTARAMANRIKGQP